MSYFFPAKSKNSKTGLLTSTSSSNTCPHTCPLRGKGCYARYGNLGRVWAKVDSGELHTPLHQFLQRIRDLPEGTLWRHNQAGDLPGPGNRIDAIDLKFIVDANRGRRGFTYTHKPLNKTNVALIKKANAEGFTINCSVESLARVDAVMDMGLPAAVLLPKNTEAATLKTPAGRTVLVCPQQRGKQESCATRKLCSIANRSYAIGFIAHGSAKNMADAVAH